MRGLSIQLCTSLFSHIIWTNALKKTFYCASMFRAKSQVIKSGCQNTSIIKQKRKAPVRNVRFTRLSRERTCAKRLRKGALQVSTPDFSSSVKRMQLFYLGNVLRSAAMVMTVSVVACSSSSSIAPSLLSSPSTPYWSRSCCKGGALGNSCLTTSRLMFGACLSRSLLRICDLMACSLISLLCCLNSHVEHCSLSSVAVEGCWCAVMSPWPTGPHAINTLREIKTCVKCMFQSVVKDVCDVWFAMEMCLTTHQTSRCHA